MKDNRYTLFLYGLVACRFSRVILDIAARCVLYTYARLTVCGDDIVYIGRAQLSIVCAGNLRVKIGSVSHFLFVKLFSSVGQVNVAERGLTWPCLCVYTRTHAAGARLPNQAC